MKVNITETGSGHEILTGSFRRNIYGFCVVQKMTDGLV